MSDELPPDEYHRQMQEGRAQLEVLQGGGNHKKARLTLSEIVELLLVRNAPEHSSVSLSLNSKGETQIEVSVRTEPSAGIPTVEAAMGKAIEVYDALRIRYPRLEQAPPPPAKTTEPPSPSKGA